MKFSLILAATVALNNAFVESQTTFSRFRIVTDLNNVGNLVSLDPFKLDLFFEKARLSGAVTTELYTGGNAAGGDCSKGTLVPSSQYQYKVSTGIESNSSFKMLGSNTGSYTGAYDITNTTGILPINGTGTFDLCARQGFQISVEDKEFVAYIDTHVTINVTSTVGDFASFSADIAIEKTAMGNMTTDAVGKVGVKAGLCSTKSPAATSYKIGQLYSICVEPDDIKYRVKGCMNVTCKTPHYSRDLFVNGAPTALSHNLLTHDARYDTSGVQIRNFGGFISPVFSGYFTNDATKFSCSGVVALTRRSGRRLEYQRFEFGSKDLNRLLQEEGSEGGFNTEIQLDDGNTDLLTAGTSMVSILGTLGLVGLSTLMVSMM